MGEYHPTRLPPLDDPSRPGRPTTMILSKEDDRGRRGAHQGGPVRGESWSTSPL